MKIPKPCNINWCFSALDISGQRLLHPELILFSIWHMTTHSAILSYCSITNIFSKFDCAAWWADYPSKTGLLLRPTGSPWSGVIERLNYLNDKEYAILRENNNYINEMTVYSHNILTISSSVILLFLTAILFSPESSCFISKWWFPTSNIPF